MDKEQKPRKSRYQRRLEEPYRCMIKGFHNTDQKSYFPSLKFYGIIKMNLTVGWGEGGSCSELTWLKI